MKYYRLIYVTISGIAIPSKRIFTEAEKQELESTRIYQDAHKNGDMRFELVETK